MHQRKRRNTIGLVALSMFLLTTSPALAQRLPLPPHEQESVNHAVDHGVSYLKRTQQKNGSWVNPRGNWEQAKFHGHYYAIGFTALPGLTLLECGVPPSDPIVQQAARFVRSKAGQIDRTYELSLAILFLDRLGDPEDKKLIQTFALRLIAGQSATGGWGYKCPILSGKIQMELLTVLRHLAPPEEMPRIARRDGKKQGDVNPIARVRGAPVLQGEVVRPDSPSLFSSISRSGSAEPSSLSDSTVQGNSGERFSPQESIIESPKQKRDCLGLAILDEKNPENLELELETPADQQPMQAKPDTKVDPRKSTKNYVIPERMKSLPVIQDPVQHILQDPLGRANDPFLTTTDNSNTQFAILALWRAQQYDVPTTRSLNLIVRRYLTSQNGDGSWGYHYQFGGGGVAILLPNAMTCVGLIGLAVGHGLAQAKPAGQAVQDPRIVNGLISLSGSIGQPVEQRGQLPMQNLYFLWSLERVAVLYNLPTIGEKDWYRWGAQILVRNQESDGNWTGGRYIGSKPPIDTCLALLFLKRVNLVKDLTAKLPFTADELNNSIMEKMTPPPKQTELPKRTKKPPLPAEPPKTKEIEKVVANSPSPRGNAEEAGISPANTGNSKKKWIVVFSILFVAFSGGSLVLILLAINQNKAAASEEKPKKPSFSDASQKRPDASAKRR